MCSFFFLFFLADIDVYFFSFFKTLLFILYFNYGVPSEINMDGWMDCSDNYNLLIASNVLLHYVAKFE